MTGRLFLAGGGNQTQSKTIDGIFASHASRILYMPYAMNFEKHSFKSCKTYMQQCFPHASISLFENLLQLEKVNLDNFDSIYIGGGSTPKQVYFLKAINFFPRLRTFHECGGHIYGGSAGAIVLGQNMLPALRTLQSLPPDITGAGLFNFNIWPHYKPEQDAKIFAQKQVTIAIPEDGGIIMDSDAQSVHAIGDCYLFNNNDNVCKVKLDDRVDCKKLVLKAVH